MLAAHPGDEALTLLERSSRTEHWTARAGCASSDPDLFFHDTDTPAARDAKAICRDCPVAAECLAVAVQQQVRHGIWGGLLPSERRPLHAADARNRKSGRHSRAHG
ncbi:WhiB family transcriptional regulator [Nonomuraea sp. K274]|uniref:Transcriptional regulator WhiB n=2 Tax=Nonomuraea cypriaca TaxID=1187855 RepID=A0A931ANM5_9ACTN|nr:WhiB family transcriptional regulator [Nonomuraea cypriaca]